MLVITDAAAMDRALNSSLDRKIVALLTLRRDQLLHDTGGEYDLGELAQWIVIAPGDPLSAIERALGFPISAEPPWEWVLDHQNGILEAPTICSDDGFGVVLIVPDEQGVDAVLLKLLRRDAVAADLPANAVRSGSDTCT